MAETDMLDRMVRIGLLYSFYGGLLTEKQRQAMELYYLEDWSLAEIAAADGVSRQAVHDLLQRSERTIVEYEDKLGLLDRFLKQQQTINSINKELEQVLVRVEPDSEIFRMLKEIAAKLAQMVELDSAE